MKIGIVIQARTGSTRLPNKVLLLLRDRTVLEWGVERMRRVDGADEVIVATTTSPEDDAIVKLCEKKGISVTRGSETDVLSRYYGAACEHKLDVVARITSDCPLIEPRLTGDVIRAFQSAPCDVAANIIDRKFPRGFDTEVVSTIALKNLIDRNPDLFYREHVTPFFYEHPQMFKLCSVAASGELARPDIRICIDTPEDYDLLQRVFAELKDPLTASAEEIVRLFQMNPEWLTINANVFHLKQGGKS